MYQKGQERKAAVIPSKGGVLSPLDVAPELGSKSCPPLGSSFWAARPPELSSLWGADAASREGATCLEVGGISFNLLRLGFLV